MLKKSDFIVPDWPAPPNVHALQTTRIGGVSLAPYDTLNLGSHVGDDPLNVAANRQLLNPFVPSEPVWLNQVHGTLTIDAETAACTPPEADASYTQQHNVVCATMTADCLPLLFCNQAGTEVAAVHAGWKGLMDGVIESALDRMQSKSSEILVWLGPAIGPQAFEVGSEVRDAFIKKLALAETAFRPYGEKWLGDIFMLARQRLAEHGVTQVYGGGVCTYSNPERFFSFRRDNVTGRMATLIWLA
ncbi:MAG TPA: peptidoglycan editing factor PgeF [Methylotenera sp.]|nr:peptidoglycan editing factor PgeF [Methylotenera sp.]HPV45112.1 peptidoglycan editing factor PgeF [Methylotenera sp.]